MKIQKAYKIFEDLLADQPPFSPIRSGPNTPSRPSRQKQFPSSQLLSLTELQ
jgi:hypothetical protein